MTTVRAATCTKTVNLLHDVGALPFEAFNFQGYIAKRRIVEYGWEYDFATRNATATKPMPDFLLPKVRRLNSGAAMD